MRTAWVQRCVLAAFMMSLALLCAAIFPHAKPAKELQILDAIVLDIVTNPGFESERTFYGTPGDTKFALVSSRGYGLPWPWRYHPSIPGYTIYRVEEGENIDQDEPRLLGLRIDKFSTHQQDSMPFNSPIEITILNAGGSKNGGVIGGCSVYYSPKRRGDRWLVEVDMLVDP